jgi:hypothetical protein
VRMETETMMTEEMEQMMTMEEKAAKGFLSP